MTTQNEKADLSSLRIQRGVEKSRDARGFPWKPIVPLILIVVVAAAFFAFKGLIKGTPVVEAAVATLTTPSQANTVLTANGYVVAQIKAAVATKGTGRLVYLGVEEGDKVKKGQILARLEDEDMQAQLDKAKADLGVAQADYEDAKLSLERQKALFASALASKADLDAAVARFNRVKATIVSAQAAVSGAEVALENTRIRAPFDGTVLTKNADVGEVFAPFAASANSKGAVVTMADMKSLQVEADVSESNIIRVRVGQPCEIVLDAYPEKRYPGVVHKIVPTADRAKATVLTKVAFRQRDDRVLPEMSAKVFFLSKEADPAAAGAAARLTVPLSAVTTRDDKKVVLLIRDGRIVESPVRIGEVLNDRIEILEGLVQGDRVVLRPDPSLTTGSQVSVAGA